MKKKAVAIKYNPETDNAPKVVASGKEIIAQKIVSLAEEKGVPIIDNPNLVEQLIDLELNQEIPPDLYEVIAEVLAFIYNLNNKIKE